MKDYPLAPELVGVTSWVHSIPLEILKLRGKVIGVAFFSYGCGNCQRFMPHMQAIYKKFGKEGFVFLGVHSPEFEHERYEIGLKSFLMKYHLSFPVAVDNNHMVWKKYKNQYWPTLYLIDKQGRVRERHIGEGGYHRIEHDIAHLLKEN